MKGSLCPCPEEKGPLVRHQSPIQQVQCGHRDYVEEADPPDLLFDPRNPPWFQRIAPIRNTLTMIFSAIFIYLRVKTIFAGFPATITLGGMFPVTTAPLR